MNQTIDLADAISVLKAAGYKVTEPSQRKPAKGDGWADYDVNAIANKRIAFPSPVMCLTFADGEKTRMSFATVTGKPLNVGRGARVCMGAYKSRMLNRKRKALGEALADHLANLAHLEAIRAEWLEAEKAAEAADEVLAAWYEANPKPGWDTTGTGAYTNWARERDQQEEICGKAKRFAGDLAARYRAAASEAEADYVAKLRVTVPRVTGCHVEINGEQVAAFEPANVNAKLGIAEAA